MLRVLVGTRRLRCEDGEAGPSAVRAAHRAAEESEPTPYLDAIESHDMVFALAQREPARLISPGDGHFRADSRSG